MSKRKHSTDSNQEKKKPKKTRKQSKKSEDVLTQETLERFFEDDFSPDIVKNLIDFTEDKNSDSNKNNDNIEDIEKTDEGSPDDSLTEENVEQENIDNSILDTSIPVFVSQNQVTDLDQLLNSIKTLKDTVDQVILSNKKLTRSNIRLQKSVIKQKKMTRVLIKEVVKLKKKNTKILKMKVTQSNKTTQDNNDIRPHLVNNHSDRDWETMISKKHRVLPNWRQLFFKRRDEFKREFKNKAKAEIYEHYKEIKYLPRKFRPKFARSQEEYNVKEKAAFDSLEATRRVCLLDAEQAHQNYTSIDSEALAKIQQASYSTNECQMLESQWRRETCEAEPKAKEVCYREITFMNNLPYSDEYNGYVDLSQTRDDADYVAYNSRDTVQQQQQSERWTLVAPRQHRRFKDNRRNSTRRNDDQWGNRDNRGSGYRNFQSTESHTNYNSHNNQHTNNFNQQNFQ